jgi:hypothetical protein
MESSDRPAFGNDLASDETLHDIARLLALIDNCAPATVAHWWEHELDIPSRNVTTAASVTSGFEAPFVPVELNAESVASLRDWVVLFGRCKSELRLTLRIVLDRLNAAKRRYAPVDRAIELGIAAESLFHRADDGLSELSFKLATRAAWFLGNSRQEREDVFRCFRALYDARSKAVHNGVLPDKIRNLDVREILSQSCDLLVRAVIGTLHAPETDLDSVHLG